MGKKAVIVAIAVSFLAATLAAMAYQSGARSSLLRSRDQVADQRHNLERAYADIDRKINELQNQKYQIGRYLTDCDRTLRDLDRALASSDAAYRGR
jgi:septal ring factor EnvC (AmiA/AmiB activator)